MVHLRYRFDYHHDIMSGSALAMEISKYNIIHCQVAWINNWLNKLNGLLYAPPGLVADNLHRNSIAFATESLVNCLHQTWISIDSR